MHCTRCGADVEAQFLFCPQCGMRLGNGRENQPLAGERKLVTVLFCDLTGSTALADRLDAEEFGDLLDDYIRRAFAEVYRFDGHVNQLAGDGFMAMFGAPVAHEDAPERAVRAALAVQRAIAGMADHREPVKARIGIHTGPVVVGTVGTDRRTDYTAIGDTTNLAARLETLAPPGSILMSEATERLVRGRFAVQVTGPLDVKGKADPIVAYEVRAELRESGAIELAVSRGLTPFVGRFSELSALEEAFAHACAGSRQVVPIVGDAGSGKSRLLYEFQRRLSTEPVVFFEGRCASLSQSTPFHPFVSMFRRHYGILPGDTVEQAVARVEACGVNWTQEERPHRVMLVSHLLDPSHRPPTTLSADELKQAVFDVVETVLTQATEEHPVVVIVEDIHWIDDVSRELLERLVQRLQATRTLVLVSHRPQEVPPWRPRATFVPVMLQRLSEHDVSAVLRGAADAELHPDLERRLVKRAAGSPFFAEELVRGLLETGSLRVENGVAVLGGAAKDIPIPNTVQEVIAARLDRLPAIAKRTVQVAAVIGRQFSARQLAQVLDGEDIDVDAALLELERRGLIHRKGAVEEDTLRFGESLTQEVAYESLLLKQRRLLHERVATVLEAASPGIDRWALLAFHYVRSDDRPRAIEALLAAGAAAEQVPSYDVAARFYEHARILAEEEMVHAPTPVTVRALYDAVNALCRYLAMFGIGDRARGEALATQALELNAQVGDASYEPLLAYFRSAIVIMQGRGHFQRALALGEEAFARAQANRQPLPAMNVARGLTFSYLADGRFELASRTADWILAEVARLQDGRKPSDFGLAVRWLRGVVFYGADDLSAARRWALDSHAAAVEWNNRTVQCVAASLLGQIELSRGDDVEAQRWADLGLSMAEGMGNKAALAPGASVAWLARVRRGVAVDPVPYVELIETGLSGAGPSQVNYRFVARAFIDGGGALDRAESLLRTVYDIAGGRFREAISAVAVGDILAARGRADDAERSYREGLARAEAVESRTVTAEALLGLAELAAARGDVDGARRDAARARVMAHAAGSGFFDARFRALLGTEAAASLVI